MELLDEGRFRYLNLQFDEDRLVGATTLGLTQHVGVLRGLIQSRLRLGVWKQRLMADPTRIMEAKEANSFSVNVIAVPECPVGTGCTPSRPP